jgi:hypothetical protein
MKIFGVKMEILFAVLGAIVTVGATIMSSVEKDKEESKRKKFEAKVLELQEENRKKSEEIIELQRELRRKSEEIEMRINNPVPTKGRISYLNTRVNIPNEDFKNILSKAISMNEPNVLLTSENIKIFTNNKDLIRLVNEHLRLTLTFEKGNSKFRVSKRLSNYLNAHPLEFKNGFVNISSEKGDIEFRLFNVAFSLEDITTNISSLVELENCRLELSIDFLSPINVDGFTPLSFNSKPMPLDLLRLEFFDDKYNYTLEQFESLSQNRFATDFNFNLGFNNSDDGEGT